MALGAQRTPRRLIVASASHEQVAALLQSYEQRFAEDFLAVLPPSDKPS
ncbi:MAG: hypothetical protein R2856_25495 [Caldilineaceae bacterium]